MDLQLGDTNSVGCVESGVDLIENVEGCGVALLNSHDYGKSNDGFLAS